MFKLKVYQSEGFAFEHLFAAVLEASRPGFLKIKPYGNQGDRGNDGYEKAHGRYFQVFAPNDPSHSLQEAINKVETDFVAKLLPYWGQFCAVKEYFFVFNDKYRGTVFPLEKSLTELQKQHGLVAAEVFRARDLEDEFMLLAEDQIMSIIGGLPDEDAIAALDYSVIAEVMQHIQDSPPCVSGRGKLVVPDIDEKIWFNGLERNGHWLKAKQAETWQLDEYFSVNSSFTKQDLRDYLASLYASSLRDFPSIEGQTEEELGDVRFAAILQHIAPSTGRPAVDRVRRDVALVIMAKYFETCDIFEEPRNAAAG
ncbi:ABC-three component system protein [Herbaspirillum sp. 1130]|uniref:ABC-three component system protein n=1 Tax=Herbaspirillum sp. 1130 TaxID=2806562 RepID=UPI001FD7D6F4|nr:ABC-three component system protein [Herbaspirillum sp. 1130]